MPVDFKPRLWPAMLIALFSTATAWFVMTNYTRETLHFYGLIGAPILGTAAFLLWWLVGSRVKGLQRWLPVLLFQFLAAVLWFVAYREAPFIPAFYCASSVALLWLFWLMLARPLAWRWQFRGLLAVIMIGWGFWFLLRIDGTSAELVPEFRWIWQRTSQQEADDAIRNEEGGARAVINDSLELKTLDFAEFRGPKRDNVYPGRIRLDWDANPPKELWRHRVGSGWGSFAVVGRRAYTLAQIENHESLICRDAETGQLAWTARIPGRFFEGLAGEGPRSTPMIVDRTVYCFTATGKLGAFDAESGKEKWIADVTVDLGAKIPQWGFSSSPLVFEGKVFVFTGAPNNRGLAAYDAATGKLAWAKGQGGNGYSSPQRAVIHGEEQILIVSDFGLEAFSPGGEPRWQHEWRLPGVNRVGQPTLLPNNEILFSTGVGRDLGAVRIRVIKDGGSFRTEQVWKSKAPKQYFNDGVVHQGYYYGFDDKAFVCIDLADGRVVWNAGLVYGFGQVLLIPAQNMLLVQSVDGPVVLVEASPKEHNEIGKLRSLDKKTWNHPVIANGRLFVRNNIEAVCYDLRELQK